METPLDVTQNSSPAPENQLPETPVVVSTVVETPAKGSQTQPEQLYAALAEERRLRKEAEDKLNSITTTTPTDEVYSDEGKVLQQQIESLQDKIEMQELHNKLPKLKDMTSEFNEFRKDYPRHKLENVAKLFLSEKGLLDTPRQGLENPTGGQRVPVAQGMTPDEIKHLRENDYRKYTDMLKKGLIKI